MAKSARTPEKEETVVYRYVALDSSGKQKKGTIKAANEAAGERLLRAKGYQPVSIEISPTRVSLEALFPSLFAIKDREVITFSRQLATLLEAGIDLLNALQSLAEQKGSSRAFRKVLNDIIRDLRTGSFFSQALTRHPRVFSEIYCRTIAVGERTGSLEVVLKQMADYLEKASMLSKKVTKALSYPAGILLLAIIVIIILFTTALPPLIDMFTSLQATLPLPTRILIAVTDFFSAYKLYVFGTLGVVVVVGFWYIKQPSGRKRIDRMILRAPLFGPPVHMGEMARFSRTMSILVAAGLPLQEIVEILPQTTKNTAVREALGQVRQQMLLGEGLSAPMSRSDLFPSLLTQMVTVGEESNSLDSTMAVVADFYDTTASERFSSLVSMIQPITIIGIALFVGFIAISILMPMYTITGSFS